MTTDSELLRQFVRTNAEDAFAELVRRHVGLVYSVALRHMNGDEHLAKDVAQTVFTDLARKAGSLAGHPVLSGWLYTSAHFAANKIIRTESRRREREEKFMGELTNEAAPDPEWSAVRPALDDAMHDLKEADRVALLLRYFEGRQFAEVGSQLGLNEEAARKRVDRALEKLRASLAKRGITTATALAAIISANAIQMVPANLSAILTAGSLAAAGTGSLTLIQLMTAKIKLALSTLVVAGAATALVVQNQTQEKLRADNGQLQLQVTQLQSEAMDFSNQLAAAGDSQKLSAAQLNELLKLRGEVGGLRRQAAELAQASQAAAGENRKLREAEQKITALTTPMAEFSAHQTAIINTTKELALAMRIYAGDNNNLFPTNLDQVTNEFPGRSSNVLDILYNTDFVNIGNLNSDRPNMVIMLRERMARQAPNGGWNRIYGFADGSVQTATSYDGNFDQWEKINSYVPVQGQ